MNFAMFDTTISYALFESRNTSGDRTYGAPQPSIARVERYQQIVRSGANEELLSSHKLALPFDLPAESRVWLAGATQDAKSALTVITSSSAVTRAGHTLCEAVLA